MQRKTLSSLLAMTALAVGCRDAKVASYRVPHEDPEPLPPILTGGVPAPASAGNAPGSDMAATAVPTATGNALVWTAPPEWKPKPASAMRKGSYAIVGPDGAIADLSITAFPGDVGGELANLNRWRGQLELPPVDAKTMEPLVARLDQNGLKFAVVEFVNRSSDKPQRILGALVPYDGATWFFKIIGPETLVAQQKPLFFALLQTVKPAAATAP